MLALIMAYIRMRGVRVFPYLDDILITARSRELLVTNVQLVIDTLTRAGYVVNAAKSSLDPSQDKVFIGARFQTHLDLVSLPPARALALATLASTFQVGKAITARVWLSLLGKMAATLQVTKHARLHMRPIQLHLSSQWNRKTHRLLYTVRVSPEVYPHLLWWTNQDNLLSGLPLSPVQVEHVVMTDASSLGWGGVMGQEEEGANWSCRVYGI